MNKIIGKIKCMLLDNQLNKELEKANKLYKEKSDTVVCKYCGKLLKKQEAGQYYDIPNKELVFFHEECFDKNEKVGTLKDLERQGANEQRRIKQVNEKEMLDIIDRIIRCNSLTYFGYNTVQVGYEALEKIVKQYKEQQKEIEVVTKSYDKALDMLVDKDNKLEDLQNQTAELKDKLDTKDKVINKMAERICHCNKGLCNLPCTENIEELKEKILKEIENE